MTDLTDEEIELLEIARTAAKSAYCPYSNFPVGAAIATEKGVFIGCNIENASYGLAVCAERVALFNAIANGAREFIRLAVSCIASKPEDPAGSRMPCGACRQVIAGIYDARQQNHRGRRGSMDPWRICCRRHFN